ncbi:hypothetical protein E1281_07105 [Actinomadura sp. KC345]|uniref:ankyrin repeat domain-containing protein n=1 Tax=Actinomadura sp. KC345 TaxID=2530371 RepID=UPI00104E5E97|nr:ankyrin repeat domain-containing protein [Actinomadura sp. KC345]TDC56442.1 hypothetical protein E1281_07105 [Actinomadura sp. KC345]
MRKDHPLIEAAKAGDLDRVVEVLDAEPESVNVRGWMGITPLIAAAWHADSAPIVRLLLERGADPLAARSDGDGALHWAAGGEVAELVATAAGPAGLAARYLFGRTPLHIAVANDRADVVRAFLAAGAETTALDSRGRTPLDLADDPRIARLLIEAGAPLAHGLPTTPLHRASERAAVDDEWAAVVDLLLERGADPGRRDWSGALPSDLIGDGGPHELRERLVAHVEASGRSVELTLEEVAQSPQGRVTVHPELPEALTTMFSGTVLVRWRLAPSIEPAEVIRVSRRTALGGPHGGTAPRLAFSDGDSVWLRDWADLRQAREVAAELLPDDLHADPVLSPDGRRLVVASCECLRLIDLDHGEVAGDKTGFGDWSVVPRFAPDGRTLAVGNSMQGSWWLTVLEADGDGLRLRYERETGLPTGPRPEIVTDVAFAPDGRRFATWVRPDHGHRGLNGHRGLVATTWTHSGEPAWHQHIDDVDGTRDHGASASLCFTPDGTRLAVGLDSGVVWLHAETGHPLHRDHTTGAVNALTPHPTTGILAATDHGLRLLLPPTP